jgi:hypothetical protein
MNKYLALHHDIFCETENPIDSKLPITSFKLPENQSLEKLNDLFITTFAIEEERRKKFIEENLTKYSRGEIAFSAIVAVVFRGDFIKTYSALSTSKYGILLNPNISAMERIDLSNKKFVLDFTAVFNFYELFRVCL